MHAEAQKVQQVRKITLADAPRAVPYGTVLASTFGGAAAAGWWLVAVTSVLIWMYPANSELVTYAAYRGRTQRVPGTVDSIEPTEMSELSFGTDWFDKRLRWRTIYAVHFSFRGKRGETLSATSYASRETVDAQGVSLGIKAMVEVTEAWPASARLVGMRSHPYGWASAWVCLFPIVGLLLAGHRAVHGVRELDLMRHGALTYGALVKKELVARQTAASRSVVQPEEEQEQQPRPGMPRPRVALTFEYSLPAEQSVPSRSDGFVPAVYAIVHVGTEEEAAALERGAVAGAPILYLPTRPSSALLVDALPSVVRVNQEGIFDAPGALLLLISPGAALAVNLLFWMGGFAIA